MLGGGIIIFAIMDGGGTFGKLPAKGGGGRLRPAGSALGGGIGGWYCCCRCCWILWIFFSYHFS